MRAGLSTLKTTTFSQYTLHDFCWKCSKILACSKNSQKDINKPNVHTKNLKMPEETLKTMKNTSIEHLFYSDGGVFHQHVKKVKKNLDVKEFDKLTNFGEKVQHVKKSGIQLEPEVTHITKNLEKALELKDQGNKLFKERKPIEAKDFYTKALMHCPFNNEDPSNNKEYSIILANRSAALDQAYLFEAALQDIDLALKCGYPKELKFKVSIE